ncbi:MAG: non-homologous end-joining DNA ligase [Solirubrobacteraceae bacterium]|nr:non-homologous end-joining DNA ligase [Solirubrobacteraceae bacterium]
MKVGRRTIELSHPDKVLIPDGITKRDIAEYYAAVAPAMVPHLKDRPLALQAFPAGIERKGFFMKNVPDHFPSWIARATLPKRGGEITHVLANEPATLVYLAGQNVVTPHVWLSRADMPRRPDRLTFDFDPSPGASFADVRAAARDAGERLRDAGLATFAMVTGSRGVHVVCPLKRTRDFDEVHAYARAVAEAMVEDDPKRFTLVWKKAERGARVYLDMNRIAYAQHAVAPYGIRPRAGAPVAMPIAWDELSSRKLKPDGWTIRTAPRHLDAEGDAWADIAKHARPLPAER